MRGIKPRKNTVPKAGMRTSPEGMRRSIIRALKINARKGNLKSLKELEKMGELEAAGMLYKTAFGDPKEALRCYEQAVKIALKEKSRDVHKISNLRLEIEETKNEIAAKKASRKKSKGKKQ